LQDHLDRLGMNGAVKAGLRAGTYQVSFALKEQPLISIIIPTKDRVDMLARCLNSILPSTYARFEILIVENGSKQPETFNFYRSLTQQPNVRVLQWDKPFNFAALNNFAAKQAAGEVLLFLNNDVQVINPDWLERLLEHAGRPQVGAVGAKLYYPDDTLQHGGVVISPGGGLAHQLRFAPRDSAGYGSRLVSVQNLAAVTGACLMTRKAVFEEVGGFDEIFVITFNDIDLCFKIRQTGKLILWTPFAELYHFESVSRGYEDVPPDEYAIFQRKWQDLPEGDPYANPHVLLEFAEYRLRT
jgi:GT2 family glycosyltransferase